MSKARKKVAAAPADDACRQRRAEPEPVKAVIFGFTEEDKATAAEWATDLKWSIATAVRDPRAVSAAVYRNQACAVITTTAALARLGREATTWLIYQIGRAEGVLYAGVIRGATASDDTAVLPVVTVAPPSTLPGVAA